MSGITPSKIFKMTPARGITRGHKCKVFVPHSNREAIHRYFSVHVVRLWNALPSNKAESSNLNTFKKGLSDFFGDAPSLLLLVANCVYSSWAYNTLSIQLTEICCLVSRLACQPYRVPFKGPNQVRIKHNRWWEVYIFQTCQLFG